MAVSAAPGHRQPPTRLESRIRATGELSVKRSTVCLNATVFLTILRISSLFDA